jgi:methyltransferase
VGWYVALVVLVGLERLAELVVSKRNASWSFAEGGYERGQSHYPVMVALHTGLLVGCVVEVAVADRPFVAALGWPMLVVVVAAQVLRWWCIATLGRQWNTRVIIVPGASRVTSGPYRWLRHPNYIAVALEGMALPLVHSAWVTGAAFTAANAAVLSIRLRVESAALADLA